MLTDRRALLLGFLLLCLFILHRIRRVRQVWRAFGDLPTYTRLVSPLSVLGILLPRIPLISDGWGFSTKNVHERVFGASRSDIVQSRSLFPNSVLQLLVADATAAKSILQNRTVFPKVVQNLKALEKAGWGPNILTTENDEWRKHRRIAGPSFTESNYILVWDATIEIILGYFIKWNRDRKGSVVKVPNFTEVTTQVAYMVFSTAGFGINVEWDNDEVPEGHTMSFTQALATGQQGLVFHMALPNWLICLTKRGREALRGYYELEKYILEMIEDRKSSPVLEERRDLMSNLIRASMEKCVPQEFDFTPRDLLGNISIFLFAGHETTAIMLSSAIALLATHQDEQEELYKHVRSVVPDGRLPTYQDVPQLTRVLAVIYESMRLFPPAPLIMRGAVEDSVITTDLGEPLPIPKGTRLTPMINAMHHNPKYWPDPYTFRPSRFLGDYNKDAFLPFSAGVRACIGRRFTEIEQIAALSIIVLHYRITVLVEPQYAHETLEERKTRVLAQETRILTKLIRTPMMFTPREGENILSY